MPCWTNNCKFWVVVTKIKVWKVKLSNENETKETIKLEKRKILLKVLKITVVA